MIEPKEHFDALDEIENGSMDIAITEPIHLVQDRAKEQKSSGLRDIFTLMGIMYNKDKKYRSPQRFNR